jgi:ABC-type multidrug transport system fused ATPase/permease subunit
MTILFGDIVDVFVEYENGIKFNNTNTITLDEFLNKTYFISGSLFGLTGLLLICNYLVMSCFPIAAINQIHKIRIKYFQSVLKQEIAWFDSRPSGDFASKISALVLKSSKVE